MDFIKSKINPEIQIKPLTVAEVQNLSTSETQSSREVLIRLTMKYSNINGPQFTRNKNNVFVSSTLKEIVLLTFPNKKAEELIVFDENRLSIFDDKPELDELYDTFLNHFRVSYEELLKKKFFLTKNFGITLSDINNLDYHEFETYLNLGKYGDNSDMING